MSAYIVSARHVDYLVSAAVLWRGSLVATDEHGNATPEAAVAMLETENRASVEYRYPDRAKNPENLPGGPDRDRVPGKRSHRMTLNVKAVQVLKAVSCYEYQSCEHPGWDESKAKRFCEALTHAAIRMLPGYEESAWEIS